MKILAPGRNDHAPPATLTEDAFEEGLIFLCDQDRDLARIVTRYGPPPFWVREAGFPTLILIILEQQVSLASARAAYDRLQAIASPLTPARFLELDEATLRAVGFSRQKAGYSRSLARAIVEERLNLAQLATLADEAARAELLQLKGIGPWSADIYLLMALRRPDIWPSGDVALASAVQEVKQLDAKPMPVELDALSAAWRPWRAVAARLLWHHYLSSRASRTF
jgi:DNA-3-methyladenine glycosylase II